MNPLLFQVNSIFIIILIEVSTLSTRIGKLFLEIDFKTNFLLS